MVELLQQQFVFPEVTGQKVLVLGLGGGCDIITAYAVSRLLDVAHAKGVIYGNTKKEDDGHLERVTEHIRRFSGPAVALGSGRTHGTTRIDQSVPRGDDGCPFVFLLSSKGAEEMLPGEIQQLGFDRLIGVDTGGDSLAGREGGRDRRMLRVLQRTGLPLLHIVIAPGSDGESSYKKMNCALGSALDGGRYRGCFSLVPVLETIRSLSGALTPGRTPRIILAAADGQLPGDGGRVIVPRGCKPAVPLEWLTHGFAFALA
ncbi:MAG TPA: DUF1152 domain-containing protein [Gemmataceae bacterium]|nr:DUF1152 domain-containing protein [Gemmataceae bacterium]